MSGSRFRRAALAVLGMALPAAMAAAPPALPGELRLLQQAGCELVPEVSSAQLKELDCRNDRAYFLCSTMQAGDRRLDCSIGAGASRLDWEHHDAAALIAAPGFAATLDAEPCAAWIYPDPGPDQQRYARLCAARLLDSLGCATDAAGKPACKAEAGPACAALHQAGLTEACR